MIVEGEVPSQTAAQLWYSIVDLNVNVFVLHRPPVSFDEDLIQGSSAAALALMRTRVRWRWIAAAAAIAMVLHGQIEMTAIWPGATGLFMLLLGAASLGCGLFLFGVAGLLSDLWRRP